jgi:predicted aspartyl protease
MGLAHTPVTVRGLVSDGGGYTSNFLVDSGATDSLVAKGELEKIGITPEESVVYELADGTKHTYDIGFARFTVQGVTRVGSVIFGPDEVEPILGVTILESAGFTIDPVSQTLKELPAVPLK